MQQTAVTPQQGIARFTFHVNFDTYLVFRIGTLRVLGSIVVDAHAAHKYWGQT